MTRRTRNIVYAVTGLIVLLLIVSPKLSIFSGQDAPSASSASTMDLRLPVSVRVVRPERVEEKIRSTGTVLANEEVALRSEIAGIIRQIHFKEGGRVRKGDLLVKIDDAELRAQLRKLESQERLAKDIEARRRTLYESKLISAEEYDRAQIELASITADIALTRARIEKTEIRAPFDGVIGLRYVSEGSYVTSTTHIATLQNLSSVKIDFSIPERYVNQVRTGQKIQFRVTGMEGISSGEIYAVEPKIDPTTRTVLLRALSANNDGTLLPGAFAEIEVILRQTDDALMVPTEALVPQLNSQIVFCIQDGAAQPRTVATGIRTERLIQITSGLQPGDSVITSGILQLRPGTPVRPAQEGA